MSNFEGAGTAINIANTDGLIALISALAASGALSPTVFKEHLDRVQKIQSGNNVVNEQYYASAIRNLIAAAEGRVQ
ncbi:hypothetical protein [Pseudomonas chlororaphis]|uniref:hypothetical protein n=1 Tax=Pseudomonas chlororaphis TaxID=587753 RepID=UPI0012D2B329|nr:hypothetical protein [Pseudomonas chlororaphis]